MLRKSLAFLLAIGLLCGLAGIGAQAVTPEEEARALVEQTVTVLKSGTFTVKASQSSAGLRMSSTIAADQGRFALEIDNGIGNNWFQSGLSREGRLNNLFYGSRLRRISLPGETAYLYYPDKKIYVKTEGIFNTHPMITELAQMNPEELMAAETNGDYILATLPAGSHLQFSQQLWYRGGTLEKIIVERVRSDCRCAAPYSSCTIDVFLPAADESLFKPTGVKLPGFVWDFWDSIYMFFTSLPF